MKTSTSARRPRLAGHSGGSGRRFSSQLTMRIESATTSPWSVSITGTSACPDTASTAERSSGSTSTQSTGVDFWARASATRSTFVEYGIR